MTRYLIADAAELGRVNAARLVRRLRGVAISIHHPECARVLHELGLIVPEAAAAPATVGRPRQ